MSIIKCQVDLDRLWADDEDIASVLREEIKNEFRLAIRRAIKADNMLKKRAEKIVARMSDQLEAEYLKGAK